MNQERDVGNERAAAVSWLRRQMAWEQVLRRLRQEAGVDPGAGAGPGLYPGKAA
ncbi:MAG TPA: hypothetical protein VEJ21_02350 [Acidimicrobiales bacterium]|nr:hypothetical protein [Acidimicrobiales bacterium]